MTSSTTFNGAGLDVAQNQLNNYLPADYITSEGERTIDYGARVRIAADFFSEDHTSDDGEVEVATGEQVRVAAGYADAVFTSDSGRRLVMTGETVQVADDYDLDGDGEPDATAGGVYRYVGEDARLDLGVQDYAGADWALVAGESEAVYEFVGSLDPGETLNLGLQDYTDTALWEPMGGVPGSVYIYLGTEDTIDLSTANYLDLGYWKPALLTQVIPQGLDFDKSNSYAVGGLVVMNDVRGGAAAHIDAAEVTSGSVTVRALEQAFIRALADSSIISSGGGSFSSRGGDSIAVGGTIATNIVLSAARATITDSPVTTTATGTSGDVVVEARNLSQLDAKTANLTQSAGKTVGVTLAFNSIGWKSQNILFNAVDAILGDPLIADEGFDNRDPALVEALITDSGVTAAGSVSVIAVNEAVINAESTNDTQMICIMVTGSSGWGVGLLIAKNMVNIETSAIVENTGASKGTVTAGGAVTVSTEELAEINADTFMRQLTQSVNDFGLSAFAGLISAALTEYAYTTNSGTRTLYDGELVRVADTYELGGNAGSVYTWVGGDDLNDTGTSVVLGAENYADTTRWLRVYIDEALTFLDKYAYAWGGFLSGGADGQGVGLVFVSNDVRGGVTSAIRNMTVTAPYGVTVTALETATIRANDLSSVVVEATAGWAFNGMAATNLVLSGATAEVENSEITAAAGDVIVDAENTSTIAAEIISRTQAANAGVGITLAFNSIGWDSQNILFNVADALLGLDIGNENPAATTATVTGSPISAGGAISVTADTAAAITSHVKSSVLTIAVSTLPKPPEPPAEPDDKKPAEKPEEKPEKPPEPSALKSIAVGAVIAMNKVSTSTQALIGDAPEVRSGDPEVQVPSIDAGGGDLTVAAADTATITSTVSAPATAVSVDLGTNPSADKGSIAVTVALSVSRNDIRTATDAAITDVPWVRANGSAVVSASEASAIDATSTASAVSVSASASGKATAFSGGGATAVNLIAGHTIAQIANTSVTDGTVDATNGSIGITASNSATIAATIAAISASLAVSVSDRSAGVAIGVSIARNLIGWEEWGGASPIAVKAQAVNTSLKAATGIAISASSTSVIDAVVLAASVAIAASTSDAYAVSIGGLWTDNRIATDIEASADRTAIDAGTGGLTVTASDSSRITADAMAAAVSASLSGGKGGAGSVGLSLAHNTVKNAVAAFVKDAGTVTGTGDVTITASSDAEIRVKSIAVAVSVAVAGGTPAVALAGGGAESTNVVLSTTSAHVVGGSLGSSTAPVGDVTITATSSGLVEALVAAVAGSFSFGGTTSAAFALGVSVARNFIGWDPYADPEHEYLSTDRPDTLTTGDRVLIADGARAGNVYEYTGPTLTEPAHDYDYASTPTVTEGIDYGTRVKASDGNVYRWVPSFHQFSTDVIVGSVETGRIVYDATGRIVRNPETGEISETVPTGKFYERTGAPIPVDPITGLLDLATLDYTADGWTAINPTDLSVAGPGHEDWSC